MGNHFVLHGKDYLVSLMTQDNKFTMKVRKTKKEIGEKEYIFIKSYDYMQLDKTYPQITKQFKSIQDFHSYLTAHQNDMQIIQKKVKIKLQNNKEVFISFQNTNENSILILNETNQLVQKRNQLGNTLGLLGSVLTNNHQKENQLAFAKLYSFYEKLCKKNQNQKFKENMKMEITEIIDLILQEFDQYQNRFMGGSMKKKKSSITQVQYNKKIEDLQQEINRQRTINQTLNETIQTKIQVTIQKMIKYQTTELQKIRNEHEKKIKQFINEIGQFINSKKKNPEKDKIQFTEKFHVFQFIEALISQSQSLQSAIKNQINNAMKDFLSDSESESNSIKGQTTKQLQDESNMQSLNNENKMKKKVTQSQIDP